METETNETYGGSIMKKSVYNSILLAAMLVMAAAPAWAATDYSSMSNEDLSAMRATMRNASEEERNAFRTEWQQRTRSMTTEERQQYSGRPANAPMDGSGYQQGRGRGNGGGGGGGRRMGR
jgi:hypothetical protein